MKTQTAQDIPLVGGILKLIFGTRNERFVRRYLAKVEAISAKEPEIRRLTDTELAARTVGFRERIENGENPFDLMVDAFATAREAMDRGVGIRNIFNPRFREQFDVSRLTPALREQYERTRAAMDAEAPAPPAGDLLGCAGPVAGWERLDIPVELYDAVRELYPESRPPFRARPFDVQLIGAMVLYQGKISEMKTGEGKNIVGPLACYLAACEGRRCHVVTVNDYLVQRDRDWTFPFFRALGLTVGSIHPQHMQPEEQKRDMYRCDVVYGTTSEFGFDYLRDNMKRSAESQVQRTRDFAIVDEVDSILIDEARTPLIISGPAFDDAPRYDLADRLARMLVRKQEPWTKADERVQDVKMRIKGLEGDIRNARDRSTVAPMQQELERLRAELPSIEAERDRFPQYFEVEMDKKQAHLTHQGIEECQREAKIGSFFVGENMDMPHLLQQAVRAHVVYARDRDYVIMPLPDQQTGRESPSVVIVDTFTGRPMIGRQWSDGLHQAIEAKEAVPIKQETQTVATITIQNFFKMYKRLAGMTGTADTEAQEFHDIYKLDVVSIPTNLPVVRRDFDDVVYLNAKDKWSAIVDEIKAFHDIGRPVLVGTTSVDRSEQLAEMLAKRHQIRHEVLNAKQHEREAHIIENAGQLGAVMIATNMAGRGTDIKLGKVDRQKLLEHWQRRGLAPRELTIEATDEQVRELIFRKIAPKELGVQKKEADDSAIADIELRLLRKWTADHTWVDPRKVDSMSADECRKALDSHGRFRLHRIGWIDTVEQLGGLHVIGTERHESRRIDNQLRGRSGRQGDQGSTRFFVSLEDDLMKLFAGETTMKILSRLGMKEGDAIEHPMLTKSVERAQRKVEERNFQIRKNILEYDEIMEHQRQSFYGLRQRVLEGRDVKGLIFEYIEEAAADAVQRFLDPDYPLECVAEAARQALDVSIPADRLRGKEGAEVVDRVREVAKDEARGMILVTIGEYMPVDVEPEDYDLTGLADWANREFHHEIKPSEVRSMSRREVEHRLVDAAHAWIDQADLSTLARYMEKGYGVSELCKWAHTKFEIEVTPAEIASKQTPEEVVALFTERAAEKYRQREIEHPPVVAIETTMALMRQAPQQAGAWLARWANARYRLGWDDAAIRSKMPQQIFEELRKASKEFVEDRGVERAVEEALACPDTQSLEKLLAERYGLALTPEMRRAKGEDREAMIRAKVESIVRAEMLQLERYVLLEVLDAAWKDHLRAMDQLRDGINFRAFSQLDPRVEFKKEGSRMFAEMQSQVRDRVSDYLFQMRVQAQVNQPQQAFGRPPAQQQQQAAGARSGGAPVPLAGGGMISGPGIDQGG